MTVGIVVVSHSHAVATAAVELAREMVPADPPPIAVAAGLDETTFGTDAMAVTEAIGEVDQGDGVLVLCDVGSSVLSAEMALEFCEPDVTERVRISAAPLVEGLLAAVVTAASGASLDDVTAEAQDGLAGKQEHLGEPSVAGAAGAAGAAVAENAADGTAARSQGPRAIERSPWDRAPADGTPDGPRAETTVEITMPHGLHARPAAALVAALRGLDADVTASNTDTGQGPVNGRSITRIATLGLVTGQHLHLVATGPDAEKVVAAVEGLAADGFGEGPATLPAPAPVSEPVVADDSAESRPEQSAQTGDQIVLAPAWLLSNEVDTSAYVRGDDEQGRSQAAVRGVDEHLAGLGHPGPEDATAAIIAAQRAMLADPDVLDDVEAAIGSGTPATTAWTDRLGQAADEFEGMPDPYLRERAQDVRSLRRMLLSALVGEPIEVEKPSGRVVLVIDELDAATAARLDPDVVGVITRRGSATGHGALIASGRGIPVVTGVAVDVPAGTLVALDPRTREVVVDPDTDTQKALNERAETRGREAAEAEARANESAVTVGGAAIPVEANVGSLADAATGTAHGADGSGLVRTELLFADEPEPPSSERQYEVLKQVADALGGRPLTIRTWDVGGDKPLPWLPQATEANPFLGERGLRTMPRVPEIFTAQLEAVVRLAAETPTRVMFPMVTEPSEVVWAREQLEAVLASCDSRPTLEVGIMIEVPAAAVRAADFADLVDFVSIGTNDLTQYTAAADRTNAAVARLARPGIPAVLDLIAQTAAALPGKPVAVCGDLASDLTMTEALISRGVTELSVKPPLVALVKQAVRACG